MRKATKTIISFAVVLIAGLNYIVPAFAQDPFTAIAIGGIGGASGAGLFGSMAAASGIDISWSSGGADPMDAMWNVLNPDHVYFTGEKHEANPQSDPEDIYDYIKVDIGDWLQAQTEFISEFCNNYNVTDNSSATITTPAEFDGLPLNTYLVYIPVPEKNNTNNVTVGNFTFTVTRTTSTFASCSYGDVVKPSNAITASIGTLVGWKIENVNGIVYVRCYTSNNLRSQWDFQNLSPTSSTNINWTSGNVNTNVFDGWGSAKVKIPHALSQLQSGWTPVDFLSELNRIWDGAGEDNIIIEDGDSPVPPPPIPDTPLGNVPFDDWVDLWGQGIYQQLENQSDALDLIGSNGEDAIEDLESIDSNLDDLDQTAESIDTNIGIGNGILGGIRSLAQSAVDYLEGIAEYVGDLVEEIVEGTETLISGILNQIPQAFGVIFGPIKQASSIWHYVVEWIQSIGAPFQFIWSMASGTSYYIILPVYASLAAAVVLAFYKRFGK